MSDAASGGTGSNLLSQFLATVTSALESAPEALAQALGLYVTAKAAISTVASGVAAAVSQATINAANAKYQGVPLSPATLATAIVRNVLPDSTGAAGTPPTGYPKPLYSGVEGNSPTQEAALSGLDGNRFAALVGATGMSYGVIDALKMLNRNTNLWALAPGPNYETGTPLYTYGTDLGTDYGITPAEFAEVVAHSDIRPEYIPDLLKLARNSISPADAVEMAVKQIIPVEIGQNLYAAAGGIPDQYQALVDAAGDAAGIEKMVDLLAHGLITPGQADQVFGMSRVNQRFKYIYINPDGTAGPAHAKWLGPYEIGSAIAAGDVDAAVGLQWLLDQGYDQAQAAAFTTSKATTVVAKVKEDTAGQVLKLYAAKLYTQAETTAALAALGYTAAAITVLEEQAQATAMIAAHNSAVSRVRAAYLVGDITRTVATTDLQALDVPAAAVTGFLADWDVEAATPSRHLSEAQVGKLTENGIIDIPTAVAKYKAMGFGDNDAVLLVTYIYPPPASSTPPVTVP